MSLAEVNQETPQTRHKIGGTRTIQTAVLVCEYLRARCCYPHSVINGAQLSYFFHDPTEKNGFWSADIIVTTYNTEFDVKVEKAISVMVDTCRAFVAGAGEVWT